MKKLIVLVTMFCLLSAPVWAITWHNGTPQTLAWDAVTQLADDTPVPATDIIEYELFRIDSRTGDKNNPTSLGTTRATSMVVNFTEGRWFVGVQARRLVPDGSGGHELADVSAVSWSDVPTNCLNNEDFAVRVFKKPKDVRNMRLQ